MSSFSGWAVVDLSDGRDPGEFVGALCESCKDTLRVMAEGRRVYVYADYAPDFPSTMARLVPHWADRAITAADYDEFGVLNEVLGPDAESVHLASITEDSAAPSRPTTPPRPAGPPPPSSTRTPPSWTRSPPRGRRTAPSPAAWASPTCVGGPPWAPPGPRTSATAPSTPGRPPKASRDPARATAGDALGRSTGCPGRRGSSARTGRSRGCGGTRAVPRRRRRAGVRCSASRARRGCRRPGG